MLGSYLNNQGKDMSKDFEDDDLGLDDDEFGDLGDFGDFGDEPLAEPPKNGREAVIQSVSKTGSSFVNEFKDDKLETATHIAKKAIPDKLSEQAGIATDVNNIVKEEVSSALTEVKKEANSTFKIVKKLVPENNERVNSIVNKIGNALGLDDTTNSSGPSKESIRLEAITSEINNAMGEQKSASDKEQMLRDQIAENQHKSQMELSATIASNANAIRLFNNDIANVYYRKNLELNLKSLYVQKDLLELTKTGFDTFKNQFESVVKNTALPDIVKTRNSEVAVHKIKQKAMDTIGNTLYNASPVAAFKKHFSNKVNDIKDNAIASLSGVNSGLEMIAGDSMGLSKEQLLASMLAGMAKDKAGKYIGSQISKSETGKEFITKISKKGTDVEAILKDMASKTDSDMSSNLLMGLSELFGTRNRDKYTLHKQDLNDVTLFDKRVHSSIVKVIPGLLSKIYGEIKSIRVKDSDPKSHELMYDHDSGRFLTTKQQSRKLEVDYKKKIEKTVGVSLNSVIQSLASAGGLVLDKEGRDILSQTITEYLVVKKGARNFEGLNSRKFIKMLPSSLAIALKKALVKIFKDARSAKPDISDTASEAISTINAGLSSTYANAVSVDMHKEMQELEDMGYTNVMNKFNITKKDGLTGEHRLDTKKIDKRLLKTVGSMNSSKIQRAEDAKAKEEAEAAEKDKNSLKNKIKNKFYTGGYVPGYATGGTVNSRVPLSEKIKAKNTRRDPYEKKAKSRYTGDGGKYTPAGVVHKGEYVFSKDKLKELLTDIRKGDSDGIKQQLSKVVKDVSKGSKNAFNKLQATDAYKYLDSNTKGLQKSLNEGYNAVREQTDKLSTAITSGLTGTLTSSEKLFKSSFENVKNISTNTLAKISANYKELGLTGLISKAGNKVIDSGKDLVNEAMDSKAGKYVTNKVNNAKDKIDEALQSETAKKYINKSLSAGAKTILLGFNDDDIKSLNKIWKKLYSGKTWDKFVVEDSIRLLSGYKVKSTVKSVNRGFNKIADMSKDDMVNALKDNGGKIINTTKEKASNVVNNAMNSKTASNVVNKASKVVNNASNVVNNAMNSKTASNVVNNASKLVNKASKVVNNAMNNKVVNEASNSNVVNKASKVVNNASNVVNNAMNSKTASNVVNKASKVVNSKLVNNAMNNKVVNEASNSNVVNKTASKVVNNAMNSKTASNSNVVNEGASNVVNNAGNSNVVNNASNSKLVNNKLVNNAMNNKVVNNASKLVNNASNSKLVNNKVVNEGASNVVNKASKVVNNAMNNKVVNEASKVVNEAASKVVNKASKVVNKVKKNKKLYAKIESDRLDSNIGYYYGDVSIENVMAGDELKAHRKLWKRKYKNISWEEYLKTIAGEYKHRVTKNMNPLDNKDERILRHTLGKSREFKRDSIAKGKSLIESMGLLKNAVIDRFSKHDDIEYTSKYTDYTDEQKDALKAEFFSSDEYKNGDITNYFKWLRESKLIDPGDNKEQLTGIMKSIKDRIDIFSKYKTKFNKAKDEVVDELVGKITGTGTKELTLDQESNMREEFFNTKEYKEGLVTNFDEWLESFGYKRNGTGILGRIKKAFTLKNLLKKTRKLDKAIAGGAVKLAGKGIKGGLKLGWGGVKLGAKGIAGGAYLAGKYGVGGVLHAGNEGLKGITGLSLKPSEMVVNKVRLKDSIKGRGLFDNGLVGRTVKHGPGAILKGSVNAAMGVAGAGGWLADKGLRAGERLVKPITDKVPVLKSKLIRAGDNYINNEYADADISKKKGVSSIDKLLNFFKKTREEDKTKEKAKEKAKEKKAKKNRFDKNGDGTRDGSWKDRLKNFGRKKPKEKITSKEKKEPTNILGMLTKYLPMLMGVMTTIGGGIGKAISSLGALGSTIIGGLSKLGGSLIGGVSKLVGSVKSLFSISSSSSSKTSKTPKSNINSKINARAKNIDSKKSKGIISKLKGFVSSIKGRILKKFGKKAGGGIIAKLVGKISARFVPFIGQALMAYTVFDIGRLMLAGKSFTSAVLINLLGVDLFADDAIVKDDGGNVIKPDEPDVKDDKKDKSSDTHDRSHRNTFTASTSAVSNINRANNISFNGNKNLKDILYKQDNGDGINKNTNVKDSSSANPKGGKIASGPLVDPAGGFNNLIVPKGVRVDGFQPALSENLAAMANEYHTMTGKKIPINSGYRSYEDQLALKKKYGAKAASPGKSTHEFGLAFDTNTSTATELDKLGLMKKYGFTRPVGKETWHVESAGIQDNIDLAKKDSNYANNAIAGSIGAGGDGWGTVSNARKYSRNKKYQDKLITLRSALMDDKPANNVGSGKKSGKDKPELSSANYTTNNIPTKPIKDKKSGKGNANFTTSVDSEKGVNSTTTRSSNHSVKQNNASVSASAKMMVDKHQKEIAVNTARITESTSAGLAVQKQMLDILGTISGSLDGGLDIKNLSSIPQPNIVVNSDSNKPVNNTKTTEIPKPVVDISRKKYTS